MEQINIATLLKDCPSGMELDCLMYDNLYFKCIREHPMYPIVCYTIDSKGEEYEISFNWYGKYAMIDTSKCIIFPKGKNTWEGFVSPLKFKDGDILFVESIYNWIVIYKENKNKEDLYKYVATPTYSNYTFIVCGDNPLCYKKDISKIRFATEEEKSKLFKVIKDSGYKWNDETKNLEKLVEHKFHVGDWVTDGVSKCQICFIDDTYYWYSENCILGSIESVDKQYYIWTINDAKDGDILFHSDSASSGIFIFKEIVRRGTLQKIVCYCDYDSEDGFCLGKNHTCCCADDKILYPATKKRADLLFQKMAEAGYKWNPETKTLEKLLVKPWFKVGDKITNGKTSITIGYIDDEYYYEVGRNIATRLFIKNQDEWKLIPKRFDITTLKSFESKVLVRHNKDNKWTGSFFSFIDKDLHSHCYKFVTTADKSYPMMIPFKGNEYLLGKTDDCQDFYKIWE